jgi:hypothetical protein
MRRIGHGAAAHLQFLERVIPEMLHIVPIFDNAFVDWIRDLKHCAVLVCLISNLI